MFACCCGVFLLSIFHDSVLGWPQKLQSYFVKKKFPILCWLQGFCCIAQNMDFLKMQTRPLPALFPRLHTICHLKYPGFRSVCQLQYKIQPGFCNVHHLQHKIHPGFCNVRWLQHKIHPGFCIASDRYYKGLGKRLHSTPITHHHSHAGLSRFSRLFIMFCASLSICKTGDKERPGNEAWRLWKPSVQIITGLVIIVKDTVSWGLRGQPGGSQREQTGCWAGRGKSSPDETG